MKNIDTAANTITDEQIEALMQEAGLLGDTEQVAVCRSALGLDDDITDRSAETKARKRRDRAECARVIASVWA